MFSVRRKILISVMKLSDITAMILVFFLSAKISYYEIGPPSFHEFLSMRVKIQNFLIFFGFIFIWQIIFSSFGLYHSRRLSPKWKDLPDVVKATFLGTMVIATAAIPLKIIMITPAFLAAFWVGSNILIICSRLLLRIFLAKIRLRGRNLRYMIIAGTNERAIQFALKVESRPELGYRIIGFVDEEWSGMEGFRRTAYKKITDLSKLSTFIQENIVDEVIIALPMRSFYEKASQIVSLCEEQGIIVRVLTDIFNLKIGISQVDDLFEDYPVVKVTTGAMKGWPLLAKRIIDFFASLILLIILSPFFLFIAILIKISSPGPIFFTQLRPGLNKRPFKMIKFRTMVKNADKLINDVAHLNQERGPAFKIKNDPRITKFGKFLRKISLDELPQLSNVLKGEMSLVGPRPLFYWEFERIKETWIKRRCSVKPGITGLWQVKGRSDVTFDKRIQMDLNYIDTWSLGLDLKILLKTLLVVFNGKGAA